ncbi:DNA/RNA non-specific endonuclease [Aureimonas jatrophae]|uniref:Endonuclease n=2 Tax=Aureimonas jatrophae TaxID=1166073 RepID=A0A1H0M6C1_9HYPH|nr:endonuclease G [Aureimonas jatrophae]
MRLAGRCAAVALFMLCGATAASAASSNCPDSFLGGEAPDFSRLAQAAPARELCFLEFAVLHSGATRTPLWAGEHLTAAQVEAAEAMKRTDRFHAEKVLPHSERSELSDYRKSGFDRGHMAPSGNMPDAASQADSFSLANMIPQNHRLNTGVWSQIEETVRDVATLDGEAWVVTGPLFIGGDIQAIGANNVLVPTTVWKAVYDPARQGAAVYVADNDNSPNCRILSVDAFRTMSGIDPFPALPAGTGRLALTQPKACQQVKR